MPLALANYSGGIIVTDWYSDNSNNESVKISIRFLSNEIRSDALLLKYFIKIVQCKIIVKLLINLKIYQLNYQKKF